MMAALGPALPSAAHTQCRDFMLDPKTGVPIMERPAENSQEECGFACPVGSCAKRDGLSPAFGAALRDWRVCRKRSSWPKAGGMDDQEAGVVYLFDWLDRMVPEKA